MNKPKIDIEYNQPSNEDIEATKDFEALLNRYESGSKKPLFFNFRPYAVAASVVLTFMGLSVLAYVFVIERETKPLKKEVLATKNTNDLLPKVQTENVALEPQWFLLDNTTNQQIETKANKTLFFPAYTFGKSQTNKILLNIAEITDSVDLATYFNQGKIALFISAFDVEDRSTLAFKKNVMCSITVTEKSPLINEIWQNTDYTKPNNWIQQTQNPVQFQKINEVMTKYKDYLDARQLLDSLKENYSLANGKYISSAKAGFQFSEKYVRDLKRFVSKYESNKQFEYNVQIAKQLWKKHEAQHEITVTNDRNNLFEFEIDKAGWWSVR